MCPSSNRGLDFSSQIIFDSPIVRVSVLKEEGQIFLLRLYMTVRLSECPSFKKRVRFFFSDYLWPSDCLCVLPQNRGLDFPPKIIYDPPIVRVSVLKIEGYFFLLRLYVTVWLSMWPSVQSQNSGLDFLLRLYLTVQLSVFPFSKYRGRFVFSDYIWLLVLVSSHITFDCPTVRYFWNSWLLSQIFFVYYYALGIFLGIHLIG